MMRTFLRTTSRCCAQCFLLAMDAMLEASLIVGWVAAARTVILAPRNTAGVSLTFVSERFHDFYFSQFARTVRIQSDVNSIQIRNEKNRSDSHQNHRVGRKAIITNINSAAMSGVKVLLLLFDVRILHDLHLLPEIESLRRSSLHSSVAVDLCRQCDDHNGFINY